MTEPKELEIGGMTNTIIPCDAEMEDFELVVKSVALGSKDGIKVKLDQPVKWSDEDEVIAQIQSAILGDDDWPNTGDPDWTEHDLVNPDTQLWELVEFAVMNPYFTSYEVKNCLDLNGNTQNVIYDAKKRNLIAVVGRDANYHILAPTHLAYKELLIEYDMDSLQGALHIDMEHNEEHEEHENPQSLSDFGF